MCQDRAAHLQVWWGLCVQSRRIKSWGSVSHNYNFSKENQCDFHLLWKEAKPQIAHGRHIPTFLLRGCSGEWISVSGQPGGIGCNSPSPRRCCFVRGFWADKNSWFTKVWSSCLKVYLQSSCSASPCGWQSWPGWLLQLKKPTNFSFSAWYQGTIKAHFDRLSSPSEETAAQAQHLQHFCLTLQDLKDKAVPWWMSDRDIGFWSGTESLSSYLSLDTPFQLVNLAVCLNFICLIEFMSYLTAELPSSWRVDHWQGTHGAVPAMLLDSPVLWHPLLAKDIHGLPRHWLTHSAGVFQRNKWIQTCWESRRSWTGVSYTLFRAPVTEWFDNQNTPYGYLPTGLQI